MRLVDGLPVRSSGSTSGSPSEDRLSWVIIRCVLGEAGNRAAISICLEQSKDNRPESPRWKLGCLVDGNSIIFLFHFFIFQCWIRELSHLVTIGYDHINCNPPVLIRTPKLTQFEPAQYWGGGPPGNSAVLYPSFCFFFLEGHPIFLGTSRDARAPTKVKKQKKKHPRWELNPRPSP